MQEQILKKLQELFTLIKDADLPQEDCIISGEYPIETNLIGSENAYLRLIGFLSELLLYSKQLVPKNEDFEFDNNGLWTSNIKQYLNEYSEFNIVASILQSNEQFKSTERRVYTDFVNRKS